MKNKCFALIFFMLMASSTTLAKEKIKTDKLSDEQKIQIVSTLIKNQDIIFAPTEKLQPGCVKGETLGKYLSRLIVFGSEGDKHSLKVSCEKYNSKTSPLPPPLENSKAIDCKLSAFTSDKAGESPWEYEIVFRSSSDFSSLERAVLACPGTP